MNVLILSCNTGEGHNSAAKAIKEYIELQGDVCDMRDALSFWSETSSKIISKGHIFIYRRLPKLFGIGYRFEENHPAKDNETSLMYDIVKKGCISLYEALKSSNYDAIICTHVFASMMLTELRNRFNFSLPSYFVATDYTCTPGVSEIISDGYFIPHASVEPDFLRCGVEKDKIIPSGIPIKQAFYSKVEKEEARRQLHLPKDSKIVLMVCGSMGCGPLQVLAEDLPLMLPSNAHLVVICGSNRKLFKSLTRNNNLSNTTIVGYTTRMPLYMDAADLIVTKPGGLSTTEAVNKHLPMVFINAVPGCETHNLNFFIKHNLATTHDDEEDLADLICHLINDPEQLKRIELASASIFKDCAAEIIYNKISKDIAHDTSRLSQIQN